MMTFTNDKGSPPLIELIVSITKFVYLVVARIPKLMIRDRASMSLVTRVGWAL